MLSPKHERYAALLRELIHEGRAVAQLERPSSMGPRIQGSDIATLQAWLVRAANALETILGPQSVHVRHFHELSSDGIGRMGHASIVYSIMGVLEGALDDLENGFLISQELLLAGEILDSILEEAKYLNDRGYKDPAAVLARVVLEDALRRLARGEGRDATRKASAINDDLKAVHKYSQPQWRLIQAWLDTGNAAAHGQFGDYTQQGVQAMIDGIEQFLAGNLST